MKYGHCEAYGFDEQKIVERLRLFELNASDEATAEVLHEFVIEPNCKQIVYHFYNYLFQHDEFTGFLPVSKLEVLKATQGEYLLSLGRQFTQQHYFDGRLRVGVAHSRIGMPLALYESAYQKLRTLILERIPEELEKAQVIRLQLFTIKIISLDMSLALDSYMLSNIDSLAESVDVLKAQNKKYKYRSEIDPLTHALNRTNILNVIKDEISVASMQSEKLSVVMLDFEGLRSVNAKYGHLAGDYVLKQAVERICDLLDEKSHIGRYGGDEFLLSVVAIDEKETHKLVKEIKASIEGEAFSAGKHKINISLKSGIAFFQEGDTLSSLTRRVDADLLGRNERKA